MKFSIKGNKSRQQEIKFLHDFIKNHKLATMATVTEDFLPEASVIGIAVLENLDIICSSFINARKNDNIEKNPYVALVIGWEKGRTVQYEGIAEPIADSEAEKHLKTTLEKIPSIAKYIEREFQVFYKIRPKWIRYADVSIEPWDRFEIKF